MPPYAWPPWQDPIAVNLLIGALLGLLGVGAIALAIYAIRCLVAFLRGLSPRT